MDNATFLSSHFQDNTLPPMTSFEPSPIGKDLIDLSWEFAKNLFGSDQLKGSVVLLINSDELTVRVYMENDAGREKFRSKVMEAASEKPFQAATYICHANFSFGQLPDGSSLCQDYDAILVVATNPSGYRVVESSRISVVDGVTVLSEPMQTQLPAALIVDEIVSMGHSVH